MRIVTNPGSNLSPAIVQHYDIQLTPQLMVVDGVQHETQAGITHATVDQWVRTSKQRPHVLGTSAAQFIDCFKQAARRDRNLIAIQTARKIIGSHTAAVAAAKVLGDMAEYKDVRIAVVDSTTTDLGVCLCNILAGEAIRAGLAPDKIVAGVERFGQGGVMALTLGTLDYLVKSGRATFLRAWLADLLDVTPIITFVDGELSAAARVSRSKNVPAAMADFVTERVGAKRKVWVGVAHGGVPGMAAAVLGELRSRLDVVYEQVREIHSSIYLYTGPGSCAAMVHPIDDLGFAPPLPPAHGPLRG